MRPIRLRGEAGPPLPWPGLPPATLVEVAGRGEVFVRDTGPRPNGVATFLLLHGWAASADLNWFRLYGPLATRGRVIALDHRGHGRGLRTDAAFTLEDAAADAAALLATLQIESCVIVGYSMGGPIALHLAHRHRVRGRISGMVLAATALEWRATWRERAAWRILGWTQSVVRFRPSRAFVARALREAAVAAPDLRLYLPWLRGETRRGDHDAIADAGRALGAYDFRPLAAEVAGVVPAAVVITTRDRLVSPDKQRALARAIGAAAFELDADHDAPLVAGEDFPRVILAAIDHVRGSSARG